MTEAFIGSCRAALNNLISSKEIQNADDAFTKFSEGVLNFQAHYYCNESTEVHKPRCACMTQQ